MPEILNPGNVINRVTGTHVLHFPTGKFTEIIAVADVTTTVQTVLDLKARSSQVGKADTIVGTIPTGARIFHLAIRVPSGLIGTNGDSIKLGNAVSNNGTQTFNATGTTAYVRSAVAASSTYVGTTDGTEYVFSIAPFDQAAAAGQSAALSGPLTYKIYVDNGTTGAGTGISVASGTAQILAHIIYWEPIVSPRLPSVAGRPAQA